MGKLSMAAVLVAAGMLGAQAWAATKCYDLSPDAQHWFNPTHDTFCILSEAGGSYTFKIKSSVLPSGGVILNGYSPDAQAACAAGVTETYIPDHGMPSAVSGLTVILDACDASAAAEGAIGITIHGVKLYGKPSGSGHAQAE